MVDTEKVEVIDKDDSTKYKRPKYVNTTILENNSKPAFIMRIAGGLIDAFCMILVVFGLYYLFTLSSMGNGLRKYSREMLLIQDNYKVSELIEGSGETYGHKVHENEEGYASYTSYTVHDADETGYKYVVIDNENISKEVADAYKAAVKNDKYYSDCSFNYRLVEYGITMLAGFISTSIFLLVIPLTNKRRATLGKLFAGTMLIDSKYIVPAKWYQIVGRYSFQFLIEGALPYLFISFYTVLAIPALLVLIMLFSRKEGRTLHDYVSRTKVIDRRTFVPLSDL